MNRMARLEHNPMAGIPPVPLASHVPQPFHVTAGRVRHPSSERSESAAPMPTNCDWRLVLERIGMTDVEIGKCVRRDRTTIRAWRRGTCSPPAEAKGELERLWKSRVGGPLPAQHSPGSTAGAIPTIAPRKHGRPTKADMAARMAAPITADELLGRVPVHRVAEPSRVVAPMEQAEQPPITVKVAKALAAPKPVKHRVPRPTPEVMVAQGRVLAQARAALRLTQAGAASRMFLAASTLGNYETGTVPIAPARYASIAAALKLPADWHQVTA